MQDAISRILVPVGSLNQLMGTARAGAWLVSE
jgi:hypothetical protein